jgi:hypothetical protein
MPAAVVSHRAGRHQPPANDNRASLARQVRRWLAPSVVLLLVAAAAAYSLL